MPRVCPEGRAFQHQTQQTRSLLGRGSGALPRARSGSSRWRSPRTPSPVAVALMAVVFTSHPPLVGKYTTTSLGGTVIAPSGAAVSKAKVGVRNQDTAFTRSVDSAAAGGFLFSSLPVGPYRL